MCLCVWVRACVRVCAGICDVHLSEILTSPSWRRPILGYTAHSLDFSMCPRRNSMVDQALRRATDLGAASTPALNRSLALCTALVSNHYTGPAPNVRAAMLPAAVVLINNARGKQCKRRDSGRIDLLYSPSWASIVAQAWKIGACFWSISIPF